MAPRPEPIPAAIHVSKFTFNCLLVMVFVLCICNISLVFWAVEKDLVMSVASNIHLKDGAKRLIKSVQARAKGERILSKEEAINMASDEQQFALSILLDAEIDVTEEIVKQLPLVSDIHAQYGNKPIIHNLESCRRFRDTYRPEERFMAVAGMFNTGTNILGNLIVHNCAFPRKRGTKGTGMRQQVPWGKHNPPSTHRLQHVTKVGGKDLPNQEAVFPLVIIKDPYHWAVSMCRHRYFTIWEHDDEDCPNIVSIWDKEPTDVTVKYAKNLEHYETLLGLWNEWYNEYEGQKEEYPLAYVRFEDILFNAKHVVEEVCSCVGGFSINKGKFNYLEDSAKPDRGTHAGANGLVSSIIRYGNPKMRLEGWTKLDYDYAQEHLDQRLMHKYGYSTPVWESDETTAETE